MNPAVTAFFDPNTFTVSYVACEPEGKNAVVIDPVLDYDPKSGRTSTVAADQIVEHVRKHGLTVDWILETHAHADHLSSAPYLKQKLGGQIAIGAHIVEVQAIFAKIFNTGPEFAVDGSQFDCLLHDGDSIQAGDLTIVAMHTPGHTPACLTYLMGDAAFIGDTLFMPDYGTARADFPGGDAATLYQSIQKILALPPATRLFLCHDYLPQGRRQHEWETTVREQKKGNVHIGGNVTEAQFVAMRNERDSTLAVPVLILPSVQVNMRAGQLPPAESNGVSYLKIPIDLL